MSLILTTETLLHLRCDNSTLHSACALAFVLYFNLFVVLFPTWFHIGNGFNSNKEAAEPWLHKFNTIAQRKQWNQQIWCDRLDLHLKGATGSC